MINVYFKKLHPDAKRPTRGTEDSAALDIYAIEDGAVYTGRGTVKVPTGLAFEIPEGHMGIFYVRGSMAANGIYAVSTPIDSDYRGEAFFLVQSGFRCSCTWQKGERIAQLAIIPVPYVKLFEVDELSSTARGSGAFGSTGK